MKIKNIKIKLEELNIPYEDISHYEIAITHPSYAKENNIKQSNQLYEFLGDSVFNFCISEYLFEKYKNSNAVSEGFLTKLKIALVSKDGMNMFNEKLHLEECLLLGKGEEKTKGRYKKSNIEDLFEAFVAAIYLDLGLDAVVDFIDNHIASYINEEVLTINIDYKTQLQEVLQAERISDIVYETIKEEGADHCKQFTVVVRASGMIYGQGMGSSKQKAEKEAAKHALEKLSK